MSICFSVWVTTACNLRCSYCYEGIEKENSFLADRQIDKTIGYMSNKIRKKESQAGAKLNTISIELHGGEPLINFNGLKQFVKRANEVFKGYELSYQMTTNGTILNDEIIVFLKKHVQSLTISVDGQEETHNRFRVDRMGNGTYQIVENNCRTLIKEFGSSLRVRMTYLPETVEALSDNVKHMRELGFRIIVAMPDVFNDSWEEQHFRILDKEIQKINTFDNDGSVFINLQKPLLLQPKGVCTGGCDGENIMPDGTIYSCTMAVGNSDLKVGSIEEGICAAKVKEIEAYSAKSMDTCSGCSYYEYCDCVRCKIINKAVNGDYYQPIAVQCALNNALLTNNGFQQI